MRVLNDFILERTEHETQGTNNMLMEEELRIFARDFDATIVLNKQREYRTECYIDVTYKFVDMPLDVL